jgi:CxxC motif-containing protein
MICISCPVGCELAVNGVDDITGNQCKRGYEYAVNELTAPKRNISTTVPVYDANGKKRMIPVKTSSVIPKELIFDVMKEINSLKIEREVKFGDVLIADVLGTGVDIIPCG